MYVLDQGKRFVIPRTEMTYPGHNMKLHTTAADPIKAPVDHVMADFEDACPYEFKGEKSRKVMVEALTTLDFGKKVVTVRPNNIHSKFFKGDMEAVVLGAPNRFHGIMLPKTRGPEEIREVSKLLDDLEKRGGWKYRIQIESLIETPHALIKAYEIATASDRMCGLVFGIADYAANLGIREIVENQNQNFHYSKQAEIANACYTPSVDQVEEARRVIKLYHEKGGGSMADPKSGEMIDEATIKIGLMDLAKGAQAGMVSETELRDWSAKSREITGYDILELMRRVA